DDTWHGRARRWSRNRSVAVPAVETARPHRGRHRRSLCDRLGGPPHSHTEKYVGRDQPCPLNISIVCLLTAPETISPASTPRSFVSHWLYCRTTSCGGGRTTTRTASAICCRT